MSIESCYECNIHTKKGNVIAGRVEGGVIKKGDKMILKPINLEISVKDVHVCDKSVPMAFPGDICDVLVSLKKEKDWQMVQKGGYISSTKLTVPTCSVFAAEFTVYDIEDPILIGTRVNMHLGGFETSAVISRLKAVIDPAKKTTLKKNPRFLVAKNHAEVEVTTDRPVCIELYENLPALGRFQMRVKGKSLGDGRVTKLML